MSADYIDVEVYQPATNARPHRKDAAGVEVWSAKLAPDSLAALKIKLADAVDRLQCGGVQVVENPDTTVERYEAMIWDYERALAAVRTHPDYREPGE